MNKYFEKLQLENLSIDENAVIEASAGTGKTYTIERLVVQILLEKKVSIDKILMVTFTEKATGEILNRIRKLIESLVNDNEKDVDNDVTKDTPCIEIDSASLNILNNALLDFDKAAIYTIHGFCNKIITEFPFETKSFFSNKIIDDRALFDKIFLNYLRKVFIQSEVNKTLLKIYFENYPDNNAPEKLKQKVKKVFFLKGTFKPGYDDITALSYKDMENLEDQYSLLLENYKKQSLSECLSEMENDAKSHFNKGYPLPDNRSRSNQDFHSYLKKMHAFFQSPVQKEEDERFFHFLELINLPMMVKPTVFKKPKNKTNPVRDFFEFVENMQKKYDIENIIILRMLSSSDKDFISLNSYFKKEKSSFGSISYDDMIDIVAASMNDKNNLDLINNLKRKYDYAIIDEFQDTDKNQWDIFTRLFLEDNSKRIFIIGDPKQAIYAFRGADVHTYKKAKQQIEAVNKKQPELTENYRSCPGLVDGVKYIFTSSPFMETEDSPFHALTKVSSKKEFLILNSNNGNEKAIEILVFNNSSKLNAAVYKKQLSLKIADKIKNLIQNYSYNDNDNIKNVQLKNSDIAVLCYNRSDANLIKKSLNQAGIPCAIYKQAGLFQTPEAGEIYTLLKAIAHPYDRSAIRKALHTLFFNFSLSEIKQLTEIPAGDSIFSKFMEWHRLAVKQDFDKLFTHILKETGIISRLLLLENNERKMTNYEHVLDELLRKIKQSRINIEDALFYMNDLIHDNTDSVDEDLLRIETEKKSVQIMTIHAAKGLEFPVVFLFGGFNSSHKFKSYTYHKDNEKYIDICSGNDPENKTLIQKETDSENYNLLYVAMTRAKLKLFLPFVVKPSQAINGKYKPFYQRVESISEPVEQTSETSKVAFDYFTGLKKLTEECPDISLDVFEEGSVHFHNALTGQESVIKEKMKQLPELCNHVIRQIPDSFFRHLSLFIPEKLPAHLPLHYDLKNLTANCGEDSGTRLGNYIQCRNFLLEKNYNNIQENFSTYRNSFSRIHAQQRLQHPVLEPETDEENEKAAISLQEDTLPSGIPTGEVIHHILELIDFEEVKKASCLENLFQHNEIIALIKESMQRYGFDSTDDSLQKKFLSNVYYTLTSVMGIGNECMENLRLCDIPITDKQHEAEFYLPYFKKSAFLNQRKEGELSSLINKDGFLYGKIDMIFYYKERYYFLDWKSNTIPSGIYNQDTISNVMEESGYTLQYRLYTLSMVHWLISHYKDRQEYSNKSYSEIYQDKFGGLLYVFTRGMESNKSGKGSVYYALPEWEEIVEWEKNLLVNNKKRSFING